MLTVVVQAKQVIEVVEGTAAFAYPPAGTMPANTRGNAALQFMGEVGGVNEDAGALAGAMEGHAQLWVFEAVTEAKLGGDMGDKTIFTSGDAGHAGLVVQPFTLAGVSDHLPIKGKFAKAADAINVVSTKCEVHENGPAGWWGHYLCSAPTRSSLLKQQVQSGVQDRGQGNAPH